MARRLSTKYYFMELDVSGQQWEEVISILNRHNFTTKVKVLENGDKELILCDEEKEIPLCFKNMGTFLKLEGSCLITNWDLAYAIQNILRQFKGDALVHRIYPQYIIEYLYVDGKVSRIMEYKHNEQRVIYEVHPALVQLYKSFKERVIEDKIAWTYLQIDQLLDRRLKADPALKQALDQELSKLAHELFILEG